MVSTLVLASRAWNAREGARRWSVKTLLADRYVVMQRTCLFGSPLFQLSPPRWLSDRVERDRGLTGLTVAV